jgi:hypothetical protein
MLLSCISLSLSFNLRRGVGRRKKERKEQLIQMTVKEFHPFSLMEDVELKIFFNILNPGCSCQAVKQYQVQVRFQVLTAVNMKMTVIWDVV